MVFHHANSRITKRTKDCNCQIVVAVVQYSVGLFVVPWQIAVAVGGQQLALVGLGVGRGEGCSVAYGCK
jgi:hypothetical protein